MYSIYIIHKKTSFQALFLITIFQHERMRPKFLITKRNRKQKKFQGIKKGLISHRFRQASHEHFLILTFLLKIACSYSESFICSINYLLIRKTMIQPSSRIDYNVPSAAKYHIPLKMIYREEIFLLYLALSYVNQATSN